MSCEIKSLRRDVQLAEQRRTMMSYGRTEKAADAACSRAEQKLCCQNGSSRKDRSTLLVLFPGKGGKGMSFLTEGICAVTWQQLVMYGVGILLIWLAVKKEYEPALLLPMGFGAILVNLPFSGVLDQTLQGGIAGNGIIEWLFRAGIEASEAMPILLFIGIGAMIDFGPLLSNPLMFLFGAGAQFGIFAAILLAAVLGFDLKDAAAVGIIGAADGPTSILVSQILNSKYIGAIAVAAYSYMALVPIVQPFTIRLVTTKKERCFHMDYDPGSVSKGMRLAFPIVVTMIVGLVAPQSVALVGFLMFGNLVRECGVLNTMAETAQNTLANLITLLLGLTISFSMQAEQFVTVDTIMIMAIGLFAFVMDTVGGVMLAKFMNLFLKKKINPMVGAAGISAFPMSSRVVQKMAMEEDPTNVILMHAVGANVSGQISSVIAGGMVINLVMSMLK